MFLSEITIPDWMLGITFGSFIAQFLGGLAWGVNITFKVKELAGRDDVQQKRIDHLESLLDRTSKKVDETHTTIIQMESRQTATSQGVERVERSVNVLHQMLIEERLKGMK